MSTTVKEKLKVTSLLRDNTRSYYVVNYKGNEYDIPIWEFQLQGERPQFLDCIVKTDEKGNIRITQDYAVIVAELYKVGGTYPFRIRQKFRDFYTVVDEQGLMFRLVKYPECSHFKPGEQIEARVISVKLNNVSLELVQKERASGPFLSVESIVRDAGLPDGAAGILGAIVAPPEERELSADDSSEATTSRTTVDKARALYEAQDSQWIVEALRCLDKRILNFEGSDPEDMERMVEIFRQLTLYTLEDSDLLKHMDHASRSRAISDLSTMAEHAEDYGEAFSLISSGEAETYINRQLDSLRVSENLFRPERKFRIMLCILNTSEGLMESMMDSLFEIILGGNKSHWKTEPFRPAFVNMLEIFITQYREKAMRTRGSSLIRKMIKAIAIQQLLSNASDKIDRRLNRATYYRLLASVKRYQSNELLHYAFISLFSKYNDSLEYDWADVELIDSLYMRAAQQKPLTQRNFPRHVYSTDRIKMAVDPSGVTFSPTGGRPKPILPAGLLNWENIEILANIDPRTKLKGKNRIDNVDAYWKDVMECLWMRTTSRPTSQKVHPDRNERVTVRVVEPSDDCQSLYCEIVSDVYEGSGWMELSDVARYIQPKDENIRYFNTLDGEPMLFDVIVKREADEHSDMEFTMAPVVAEYFENKHNIGDELLLRVQTFKNDRGDRFYLCVSSDGASCRLNAEQGMFINNGEYVYATILETNSYGQFVCEYAADSHERFNIWDAFRRMLAALGTVPESPSRFADDAAPDEILIEEEITPAMMREIVLILDRLSLLSDENRAQSLGLLNIAKLLCRMLEDSEAVAYYDARKAILKLLEEYGQNGVVDQQSMSALLDKVGQDQVESDFILNEWIARIRILDSLKHRDNVDLLFDIREKTDNPSVREGADLAIALLLTSRFDMPEVRAAIETKINQVLGVKVITSKLHDFGIETQELEFKSSIIFPPDNHMRPSRELQGAVIMETICGFLNSATGGQLLLGVNKNGAACGVQEDMRFLGTDEDGYGRYIHGMINREMGPIANQCCLDCRWIDDAGYKIYQMNIKPAPELIAFKGQYWTRMDTEKRPLPPDKVDTYRTQHADDYREYRAHRLR